MKNYAVSIRITAILTGVSFAGILATHYAFQGNEAEFWCNVCLAVFGSGLLTLITSCVGYITEKRYTLEDFSYSTRSLMHIINKYDSNWTLEKKIDFFLDYADIDKSAWDTRMGAIYFLCDPHKIKFNYIYQKIYKPIADLNRKIAECAFNFKLHKEGSGRNDAVMAHYIDEIERLFLKKTGNAYIRGTFVKNELVNAILKELNGQYYDIMYSKKQTESEER